MMTRDEIMRQLAAMDAADQPTPYKPTVPNPLANLNWTPSSGVPLGYENILRSYQQPPPASPIDRGTPYTAPNTNWTSPFAMPAPAPAFQPGMVGRGIPTPPPAQSYQSGMLGRGQPSSYTVASGDTLSAIAARLGTTVAALAAANGISNPNRISIGQTISMPTASHSSSSASPVRSTPAPASTGYTVRAGDTLSAIAARNGTTVAALAAKNGIADPNKIGIGQSLKL